MKKIHPSRQDCMDSRFQKSLVYCGQFGPQPDSLNRIECSSVLEQAQWLHVSGPASNSGFLFVCWNRTSNHACPRHPGCLHPVSDVDLACLGTLDEQIYSRKKNQSHGRICSHLCARWEALGDYPRVVVFLCFWFQKCLLTPLLTLPICWHTGFTCSLIFFVILIYLAPHQYKQIDITLIWHV